MDGAVGPHEAAVDVVQHRRHQKRAVQGRGEHDVIVFGAAKDTDAAEDVGPGPAGAVDDGVVAEGGQLRLEVHGGAVEVRQRHAHAQLHGLARVFGPKVQGGAHGVAGEGQGGGGAVVAAGLDDEGAVGADDEEDVVAPRRRQRPIHVQATAQRCVVDLLEAGVCDLAFDDDAAQVDHNARLGGAVGEGDAVVGRARRRRQLHEDVGLLQPHGVAAGAGDLVDAGGLVRRRLRLRRRKRRRRHHRHRAALGDAHAVQVRVREAEDGGVFCPVARGVDEAGLAEGAGGVGADLDHAVGDGGAEEAGAVGEAEATRADVLVNQVHQVRGCFGLRRRVWRRAGAEDERDQHHSGGQAKSGTHGGSLAPGPDKTTALGLGKASGRVGNDGESVKLA